jgi:hypothetical protein
MANCLPFLTEVVGTGQVMTLDWLNHDTISSLVFARNDCKSYVMSFDVFTVVDFVANVTPTASSSFSYDVKMYRVVGAVMTEVATVVVADHSASFSKEFTAGTYLICFQTTSFTSFDGTILPVFRGYQRYAVLEVLLGCGASTSIALDDCRPPRDCSAELAFELIEGSLPPGLRMNGAGVVQGIAPNLDCIDDTAHLPPAQNWSFEHNDQTYHPWGKQWRFKVRVAIAEMPEVYTEEWFCVKIHNNWSLDRDNFLSQAPFVFEVFEETSQAVEIPQLCPTPIVEPWVPTTIMLPCPDGTPPKFVAEPVNPTLCDSCGKEEATQRFNMPFGVPSIGSEGFEAWLEGLEGSQSPEVREFVVKLKESPLYQLHLQSYPIEVRQEWREVVIRTYVDDPHHLFTAWRLEENQRLPWTVEVVCSEHLHVELETFTRMYF